MEPDRFDSLATALAGQPTGRRAALRRVVAGSTLLLGLFGVKTAVPEDVAARSCQARCRNKRTARKRRQCRKRCANSAATCVLDSTCRSGQLCIGGACTNTCSANAQCRLGESCLNGTCARSCSEAKDCDVGQTCANQGCTTICTNAGDCTGAQECIRGACGTPPPVAQECVTDQECEGIFCFGGVCVLDCANCDPDFACETLLGESICAEPGSSCSPASPCPDTERTTCLFGMCVAI